ncbi:hypothetical protein SLS63_003307 [Diaporthe eres]|uniref:Heme haloperoxidase family profile domain-containing protein n=1 Tax=Diaporthe eres TaxID=83184 RepID=A0ABR1PGI4_DIAER
MKLTVLFAGLVSAQIPAFAPPGPDDDAFFGDPIPFNQTIFDETLAQWTEDTISVNTSAKGRAARIRTSNATNPEFSLSRLAQAFTTGESVAFIMVFGDVQTGVAPKAPVQFFFENEQFPPGYTPPANVVTSTNLQDLSQRLGQALVAQGVDISNLTGPRRRDVHGSLW